MIPGIRDEKSTRGRVKRGTNGPAEACVLILGVEMAITSISTSSKGKDDTVRG
jgi:hypothetical protein